MIKGVNITTKGKVAVIVMRAMDGRFTWEEAVEKIMELFDHELLNPPREK
jgi:hypothetical protein